MKGILSFSNKGIISFTEIVLFSRTLQITQVAKELSEKMIFRPEGWITDSPLCSVFFRIINGSSGQSFQNLINSYQLLYAGSGKSILLGDLYQSLPISLIFFLISSPTKSISTKVFFYSL